jgi:hypothetical protein
LGSKVTKHKLKQDILLVTASQNIQGQNPRFVNGMSNSVKAKGSNITKCKFTKHSIPPGLLFAASPNVALI